MPEITGYNTGGADILSYSLEWNAGSGSIDTVLIGFDSANTDREYNKTTDITPGEKYLFQYRVQNVHGWSEYSPAVEIAAVSTPPSPGAIIVSIVGTNLEIDWSPPSGINVEYVTEYIIEIETNVSGEFAEETQNCDGKSESVIDNTKCTIPMSSFWASPFTLAAGTPINIQIYAKNQYGTSGATTNSGSENVETVPPKPNSPSRVNALTDTSQITMTWTELTEDIDTGGSAITSYQLQWDSGTDGDVYTPIYTGTPDHTQSDNVAGGTMYRVRLIVSNKYGPSDESDDLYIRAATVPSQPGI
jgi:hypothetical protein